jgi:ABC-2 type transport system permease protein
MNNLSHLIAIMGMSIRSHAQYRFTFLLEFLTTTLTFASEFAVVYFLAVKAGTIGGWTPEHLAILYVATLLAGSLEIAFTSSLRGFDSELISGSLDLKLLRPAHPLVFFLGRVSLDVVASPFFCIAVLILTIRQATIAWTIESIIIYLSAILGGALIYSSVTIFSAAIAFWTYDSNSVYEMTRKGTNQLMWYPLDIYSTPIRAILIFAVPLAFAGYLPVSHIIGKELNGLPSWFAYISLPVGLLCITLAVAIWQIGLRRYQGAGS